MSVRVMSWVFDHAPVERHDILPLLVLADHANDDGRSAYPSVDTIARKARLSRRGTQLALRRLEAAGAIVADGKGPHGTISYSIPMGRTPLRPRTPLRGANWTTPSGELRDTKGRTPVRPTHPRTIKNHPAARELVDEVAALLTDLGPVGRTKLAAVIAAHPGKDYPAAAAEIRTWGPLRSVVGAFLNALNQQEAVAALHERQSHNAEDEMAAFHAHKRRLAEREQAEQGALLAKALR